MVKRKKKVNVKKKAKAELAWAKKKAQLELVRAKRKANLELAMAKKKFLATERKVKAYAKKNPEKAALIAAGLGAVVGAGLAALLAKGKKK